MNPCPHGAGAYPADHTSHRKVYSYSELAGASLSSASGASLRPSRPRLVPSMAGVFRLPNGNVVVNSHHTHRPPTTKHYLPDRTALHISPSATSFITALRLVKSSRIYLSRTNLFTITPSIPAGDSNSNLSFMMVSSPERSKA